MNEKMYNFVYMRKRFAEYILQEMEINEKIIIITADIGYGILDEIRKRFPDRVINVGSCENLMIGMAIGYAYESYIPICYTITPFLLYRPFEMLRNYVNHENIPLKLIGTGRDKDYAHDGMTHWAHDDLTVLHGVFQNIKTYKPTSCEFTQDLLREILYNKVPSYLNLSRFECE